jgi:hypothetical protein
MKISRKVTLTVIFSSAFLIAGTVPRTFESLVAALAMIAVCGRLMAAHRAGPGPGLIGSEPLCLQPIKVRADFQKR